LTHKDIDMNLTDFLGDSALHLATRAGHTEIVGMLLSRDDLDLDRTNRSPSGPPLLFPVANKQEDMLRLFLTDPRSDPNAANHAGVTALMLAARIGPASVVEILLQSKRVDAGARDRDGVAPIQWAARNNRPDVLRLLLAKNACEPDCTDFTMGSTPLICAASGGHDAVVESLLADRRVNVNARQRDGRTALWMASKAGYYTAVRLLLGADGIDVDLAHNDGRTPLFVATRKGHLTIVEMLLEKGADRDRKDSRGQTALDAAVKLGDDLVIRALCGEASQI
jgi:serine/threonine-protein phosphatase 6 regulatory ankyrin repeat subunit B